MARTPNMTAAADCPFEVAPRQSAALRRRAFTLIEILVVMGVIAILVTIVVIAMRVVGDSAAARATRVALQSAAGMQAEYEINAKLPFTLGNATDGFELDNVALTLSQQIMRELRKVPKNQQSLDQTAGTLTVLTGDWEFPPPTVAYYPGDIIRYNNDGHYYRCLVAHLNTSGGSPGTANWVDLTNTAGTTTDPLRLSVPVDGWKKPILFVPTGLQLARAYDSGKNYLPGMVVAFPVASGVPTAAAKSYKCIERVTNLSPTATNNDKYWVKVSETATYVKRSPTGKSFWVSAGPDNDFLSDDDNIYSFEN